MAEISTVTAQLSLAEERAPRLADLLAPGVAQAMPSTPPFVWTTPLGRLILRQEIELMLFRAYRRMADEL